MDYQFDGSTMYQGDTVFVVGIGPGKVIDTKATNFRVRAGGRNIKVSYQGVQSGQQYPTVFWRDPIICKPAKDMALWAGQQKVIKAVTESMAAAVVGHELVRMEDPQDIAAAANPAGVNSQSLQQMVNDLTSDSSEGVVPFSRGDAG